MAEARGEESNKQAEKGMDANRRAQIQIHTDAHIQWHDPEVDL